MSYNEVVKISETELTKQIKQITHSFNPKINSSMRSIRFADEVWTPTGIVDSIRFEDYLAKELYDCTVSGFGCKKGVTVDYGITDKCYACVHRTHGFEVGMMVTCFEVKITVSDFKSKNGHNFHGNENYYAVPKGIVKKIDPLVPAGIGILSYNGNWLRTVRKAVWKEIDFELKTLLLYNAMKKWCDGSQERFWAEREDVNIGNT